MTEYILPTLVTGFVAGAFAGALIAAASYELYGPIGPPERRCEGCGGTVGDREDGKLW